MWRIEYWTGQTLVAVRVIEADRYYLSYYERQHVFENEGKGTICVIASMPGMVVTRTEDKNDP